MQSISLFTTPSPTPSNLVALPTTPSLSQFSVQTNNHSYPQFKFNQIIEKIENPTEYQTTLGKVVGGAIDRIACCVTRAWKYLIPSRQIQEQSPKQEDFINSNRITTKQQDSDGCTRDNSQFTWSDIEFFNCSRPDGSSYSQWYEPTVNIWGNCTEFYSSINDLSLAKSAMYLCLNNMVKIYYQNVRESTEGQACLLTPISMSENIVSAAFGNQATFSTCLQRRHTTQVTLVCIGITFF